MAKAPRPKAGGYEAAAAAEQATKVVTEFRFRGEAHRLAIRNVPVGEIVAVRREVGLSWQEVTGLNGVAPDISSVAVFVWLARRAAGEARLSWAQFTAEFPDDLDIDEVTAVPVDEDADPQP